MGAPGLQLDKASAGREVLFGMRAVTGGRENFEQFHRVVFYMELVPVFRHEKTGRGHPIEEL